MVREIKSRRTGRMMGWGFEGSKIYRTRKDAETAEADSVRRGHDVLEHIAHSLELIRAYAVSLWGSVRETTYAGTGTVNLRKPGSHYFYSPDGSQKIRISDHPSVCGGRHGGEIILDLRWDRI